MPRLLFAAFTLLLTFCLPGSGFAKGASEVAKNAPVRLKLDQVVKGLSDPLFVTHAGDGSGRLFIVEQNGRVRVLNGDGRMVTFLDLRPLTHAWGERGLLGLAFHPAYPRKRQIFVYYTDKQGAIRISRIPVLAGPPEHADPGRLTNLLTIDNPAANHNGGMLAFGPDGYLYAGIGDGGGAGDPYQSAQNTYSHLGKILRIDVNAASSGAPYGIPETNPFVGLSNHRPEIWSLGLRNPWRFSFDRQTGDLFIADVGQDSWEEIDFEPAGGKGGVNYGWSLMEANHCHPPGRLKNDRCDYGIRPVAEYSHEEGCSVTGGYVYRGEKIKKLQGVYLFGDYCSGTVWGLFPQEAPGKFRMKKLLETDLHISSFGEDEAGELYVVDHKGGAVYRIVKK